MGALVDAAAKLITAMRRHGGAAPWLRSGLKGARRRLLAGGTGGVRPSQATGNEREYAAERQHEGGVNQKAFAGAEPIGDPAHNGRDQDRAEPLTGLAQPNDRALLVTPDGARLHREDNRLDHTFKPAARDLKQQQQAEDAAQQR